MREGVSEVNPDGLGFTIYTILLILIEEFTHFSKKRGQQNEGINKCWLYLFRNRWLRHLLHTSIEGWRRFYAKHIWFLREGVGWGKGGGEKRKTIKSSLDTLLKVFWFAQLWSRIEEKKHIKAVADVYRGKERWEVFEVVLPGAG